MAEALRVLNVDDDDAARYVKTRLLRRAGYEVLEAPSGAEALLSVRRDAPDLVLLDVKLPDMSGFEVARRIRADARSSNLPIVHVSTICVTPDDEQDGLDSGADAFLCSPLDAEDLVEAIGRVMRMRRSAATSPRKLGRQSLARVKALAKARMAENLSVADLAAAAELSPFHFARLFKAATGETPHAFLVRVRIEEGIRLLRDTPLALGAIAGRVGFRTHAHFSRAFREATGLAPREYRARRAKAA